MPAGWCSKLPLNPIVGFTLSVPDLVIFDDSGRIIVIFEIKMRSNQREHAKEQLENSIYGNWRNNT